MKRRCGFVAGLLFGFGCASMQTAPAEYLPHPTANRHFIAGLHHFYGFNYAAAEEEFGRAARMAPTSPLPQWGLALALGPSTNAPEMSSEQMKRAYAAAQRALALARNASAREQALANAIVARYSATPDFDLPSLNNAYNEAMRSVFLQFPTDSDIATLFVESQMLARRGPAWMVDGTPHPVTAEGLRILEAVMARDPSHVGANHYYLHLLDGSPTPERGLATAKRLQKIGDKAGHLLHMPSHIYMRIGDYRAAVETNRRAVAADQSHGRGHGVYEVLQIHSREYLAAAAGFTGQSRIAMGADPSLSVLLRFNRWADVLAHPVPDGGVSELEVRIARVIALSGQHKLEEAKKAFAEYVAVETSLPPEERRWWGQPIGPFLEMVRNEMLARLQWLEGDRGAAIESWRSAVAAQDRLTRAEALLPWFHPLRESLGAALYFNGQYAAAETAFRDDLKLHPNNPRSLFGLSHALAAQRKAEESRAVQRLFEEAWQDADVELRMEDL